MAKVRITCDRCGKNEIADPSTADNPWIDQNREQFCSVGCFTRPTGKK